MYRPNRATEAAAKAIFSQVDWDSDGTVPVYLPRAIALGVLRAAGWNRTTVDQPWTSPNGERYWETDEALQIAITCQAVRA